MGARVSASDTPMCAAGHVVNGVDFAYGAGKPYKYRIRCVKAPEGLTAVDGVAFGARPSGSGYASSTAANPGRGGDFPRFQSVVFLQYDGLPGSRYTLPIVKISASSADATNASTVSVDIGPIGPVPGQQNMTALCPEGTTVHSAGINASGKVTLKCSVPAS